ncbi:hypothetical protein ACIPPS_08945 [Streptomyces sp. NPDC090127]|uniref:hypothetical protein n=1 Tax=Streptomyces sp. NPDC090127 TaxID=3365953 RepID=UPI0038224CEE
MSWTFATADEHRAGVTNHHSCGQVVPARRDAYIIDDPHGRARELVEFARAWTWDSLAPAPEVWAAQTLYGYAEGVMKLRKTMAQKDWANARVQAPILAVHRPAPVIAAGTRTFFPSENHLWHLLADRLGDEWRSNQEGPWPRGARRRRRAARPRSDSSAPPRPCTPSTCRRNSATSSATPSPPANGAPHRTGTHRRPDGVMPVRTARSDKGGAPVSKRHGAPHISLFTLRFSVAKPPRSRAGRTWPH